MHNIALLYPQRIGSLILDLVRPHHFAQSQHYNLIFTFAREFAAGVLAQVFRQDGGRVRMAAAASSR